jgi:hypothetical protein
MKEISTEENVINQIMKSYQYIPRINYIKIIILKNGEVMNDHD